MSDIPETYHITGDSGGLAGRESNVFGQYDLVTTSYHNINVLLYKKNATEYETDYWMFNVTDSGYWVVGSNASNGRHRQEIFLWASVPGHGFHAPSDNWKLKIRSADFSYRLVDDTSLTVRADIGKRL